MKKAKLILNRLGLLNFLRPDITVMILLGVIGLLVNLLVALAFGPDPLGYLVAAFWVGVIYFTAACLLLYFVCNDSRLATTQHDFGLLYVVPVAYFAFLILLGGPMALGFAVPVYFLSGWDAAGQTFYAALVGETVPTAATIATELLVWLVTPFLERRRQSGFAPNVQAN